MASLNVGVSPERETLERGATRAAVERLSAILGDDEVERRARLDAFESFQRLPPPPWRLSRSLKRNLESIDLERLIPFSTEGPSAEDYEADADSSPTRIVCVDGQAVSARLAAEVAAKGAYIAPLEAALRERPDLVRANLGRVVANETHRFTALHAAFRRGGIVVYVPRGVVLEEPVEFRMIVDRAAGFPHLLIVADEDASVRVIEQIESRPATGEGTRILCSVREIVAARGARIHHAALQRLGDDVAEIAILRASVNRDATVEIAPVVLGGDIVKMDVEASLDGEGADAHVLGGFFASEREAFDLASRITHRAPHTTGNAVVLGAANGAGQAAFNGMISIQENGPGSESNLKSRTLLLSPKAHVDAVPGLEIANNDVKAYHGATIGEIDEETLFFCQARGIAPDVARRMIITGFFSPVVDAIPSLRARTWLQQHIEAKV